MAKLPWYVKENGAEFIGAQIFVNLKIRRIYIIWVQIQVFFVMLFQKPRLKEWHVWTVIFLSFGLWLWVVNGICHLIGELMNLIFG